MISAYQEVARERWRTAADRFDLIASKLLVKESGAGDVNAAGARLEMLEVVSHSYTSQQSVKLTRLRLDLGADPREAAEDSAILQWRSRSALIIW